MKGYFFDTYALLELLLGNEQYAQTTNGAGIVTTKLNLLELYYHLLVRYGEEDAENAYRAYQDSVIEFNDEDIKSACRFRATNRKLKFSFIDCVGYSMAQRRGVRFLTGDNAFKDMDNVEFVK